jgi:hypothetical protein
MGDSDTAETVSLNKTLISGWVVSSSIGVNATAVSLLTCGAFFNGVYTYASSVTCAVTGTITASTTGAIFVYLGSAGTLSAVVGSGATVSAITPPSTLATNTLPVGMIIVHCTATAFNGGTNSLADNSYTNYSIANFTGPAGIALMTEAFTTVPG